MTSNGNGNAPRRTPGADDADDAGSFSFSLTHPITVDGKRTSVLSLRRPLVRDLIAAERQPGDVGASAALLALCAGIPFLNFSMLDAADYRALTREAGSRGFFDTEAPDASS